MTKSKLLEAEEHLLRARRELLRSVEALRGLSRSLGLPRGDLGLLISSLEGLETLSGKIHSQFLALETKVS